MALDKWHPLQELENIQKDMNRLWEEFFPWPRKFMLGAPWKKQYQKGIAVPPVDIIDKEDTVLVRAELPGVEKDHIDLSVDENSLTIKGERAKEKDIKEENYYHCERSFNHFARTVILPSKVDAKKVKATFKNGVLEVQLPKAEGLKPKKIPVEVG